MEVVWNSIIHIFGVFEEVGGFLKFVKGLLLLACFDQMMMIFLWGKQI